MKCERLKEWLHSLNIQVVFRSLETVDGLADYHYYHNSAMDRKMALPAVYDTEQKVWAGGFLQSKKLITKILEEKPK